MRGCEARASGGLVAYRSQASALSEVRELLVQRQGAEGLDVRRHRSGLVDDVLGRAPKGATFELLSGTGLLFSAPDGTAPVGTPDAMELARRYPLPGPAGLGLEIASGARPAPCTAAGPPHAAGRLALRTSSSLFSFCVSLTPLIEA